MVGGGGEAFKNHTNEQKEQNANLVALKRLIGNSGEGQSSVLCGTRVGFPGLTPEATLKGSLFLYFDIIALGLHQFCWKIKKKQALP